MNDTVEKRRAIVKYLINNGPQLQRDIMVALSLDKSEMLSLMNFLNHNGYIAKCGRAKEDGNLKLWKAQRRYKEKRDQ